jgi:hypothetical protein
MLNNRQNLEQLLFKAEAENMYDMYSSSEDMQESDSNIHERNEMIFTTKYDTEECQSLLSTAKLMQDKHLYRENKLFDGKKFHVEIMSTSLEIDGKYNFTNAMNIIGHIFLEMKDTLYGVLLYDNKDKSIFNPLHPLLALEFAKQNPTSEYTIFVFSNKNISGDIMIPSRSESDNARSRAVDNIIKQLSLYTNRGSISAKSTIEESKQDWISRVSDNPNAKLKISNQYYADKNNNNDEIYIVPQQILTKGTVIPYYGTSLIKVNTKGERRTTEGTHLSPMTSANIANAWCESDNNELDNVIFDSVCTGRLDNTSVTGLLSLNHCNLSSPYREGHILMHGWSEYAQECVRIAISAYKDLFNKDLCEKLELDCDSTYAVDSELTTNWVDFPGIIENEPNPQETSFRAYANWFNENHKHKYENIEILSRYRTGTEFMKTGIYAEVDIKVKQELIVKERALAALSEAAQQLI